MSATLGASVTTADVRDVARALSVVERGGVDGRSLVASLAGRTGTARTIGVTGPPGVGKSTLIRALGELLLEHGERLAVLAVDPSSPFSGGALLGDRIRMGGLALRGAFVRSMATRGALGGLAAATSEAIDVLDVAGFSVIVVETVGVGQDEVDVAGEVDTVVVVTVAGQGDDVQTAKAGLLEIGDLFVVNKADQPGSDVQVELLQAMLSLKPPCGWEPPVIPTAATAGDGVRDLLAAISAHQDYLLGNDRRTVLRRQRARRRLERVLAGIVWERISSDRGEELARAIAAIASGRADAYTAARALLEDV